jgi:hypothetical protein
MYLFLVFSNLDNLAQVADFDFIKCKESQVQLN